MITCWFEQAQLPIPSFLQTQCSGAVPIALLGWWQWSTLVCCLSVVSRLEVLTTFVVATSGTMLKIFEHHKIVLEDNLNLPQYPSTGTVWWMFCNCFCECEVKDHCCCLLLLVQKGIIRQVKWEVMEPWGFALLSNCCLGHPWNSCVRQIWSCYECRRSSLAAKLIKEDMAERGIIAYHKLGELRHVLLRIDMMYLPYFSVPTWPTL